MAAWRPKTNRVSTARSLTCGDSFCGPATKNSSSAWATTAEIVRPDALASARTAAASRTGSLTVNTVVACGTPMRPETAARSA